MSKRLKTRSMTPAGGWVIAGYVGFSFDHLVDNWRKDHPEIERNQAMNIVDELVCQRLNNDGVFGFCQDENGVIELSTPAPVRKCKPCGG